jgi:hypothetical protein
VGHLSLRLDDEEKTYISFWPSSGKSAIKGGKAKCQTFDEDKKEEGGSPDESYFIPSRFLNLDRIRKWFHEMIKKAEYSLFGNNCTMTVYLALKEGGLELFKKNWWATIGLFIQFPDDDDLSYEDIQARKEIMEKGGIEDLPVKPQTAFSWIKDRVEELQGNKKSWWWPF